ncbi:MAG TPA: phosphatidate cytidylyltransferase [Thermoleophilaceae bacterium]|nr:phosphatidate cytidylyltransferase [Thermoleophilaceae bacterium]
MSARERAPRRPAREPRERRRSELVGRILVAIPAAAFAIFIVVQGGLIFALGLIALGIVALNELYGLMRRARPIDLAGYAAVTGMVLLATYEQRADVLIALVAVLPLAFLLAMARPSLANVSWGMAATVLGVVWIGLPLVHAVFLRSLDHGDGLVVDVLVATFVGDTAAYTGGRMWGRRKLAPDISPNKTVEGLIAGIVGATAAFWFAGLYQDWLSGWDALAIGFLVALAAPLGDLFESAIKRDLAVKDSGRIFGAHGGALDRLDAVFSTIVVGFYAALLLGYG